LPASEQQHRREFFARIMERPARLILRPEISITPALPDIKIIFTGDRAITLAR
jgi:hypothetical protein